jgi:hypothetical protein
LDYYVSIEDTTYHHWQVGMLIESFKAHGMEDQLVIGIADNESPFYADFTKNLKSHKRVFSHPNFGKNLNAIKSLSGFFDHDLIKAPFALIHPDMVLVDPIKLKTDHNITFSTPEGSFANTQKDQELHNKIEPDIQEVISEFKMKREKIPDKIYVGDVIVFNNIEPIDLFQIRMRTEQLIEKYGDDWNAAKAGMILGLYNLLAKQYRYRSEYLEGTLLHDSLTNFIHYKHGMPPVFSKLHYKYDSPHYMSTGDHPMQRLLEHNPTVGVNYIHKVIRSYMDIE